MEAQGWRRLYWLLTQLTVLLYPSVYPLSRESVCHIHCQSNTMNNFSWTCLTYLVTILRLFPTILTYKICIHWNRDQDWFLHFLMNDCWVVKLEQYHPLLQLHRTVFSMCNTFIWWFTPGLVHWLVWIKMRGALMRKKAKHSMQEVQNIVDNKSLVQGKRRRT